jgi:hypothetical protein
MKMREAFEKMTSLKGDTDDAISVTYKITDYDGSSCAVYMASLGIGFGATWDQAIDDLMKTPKKDPPPDEEK